MEKQAMSTTHPFTLGRLHVEDPGDNNYPLRTLMEATPAKKRTRPWSGGPLLNQSNIGQCVGATGREFLTSSPVLYKKSSPTMPECYLGAKQNDGLGDPTPDRGSTARGLMKFFQSKGLVSSYYWTKTTAESAEYVATRGPVCLGIPWDNSMFDPDGAGVVHPDGNEAGGHEILIEWWYASRRQFLCRNHWVNRDGTPWGHVKGFPGYFLIGDDDLAGLIQRGGDMCAGTETNVI
jgi:hypothetical protein